MAFDQVPAVAGSGVLTRKDGSQYFYSGPEAGESSTPSVPKELSPVEKAKLRAAARLADVDKMREKERQAQALKEEKLRQAQQLQFEEDKARAIDGAVNWIAFSQNNRGTYCTPVSSPGSGPDLYKNLEVIAALRELGITIRQGDSREHMDGKCTPRYTFHYAGRD